MFRDLCEQRKNLRRNLYAELGSPSEVKATSLLELRTGLSERASIIASNLKSRSKHRLTLNADHRSWPSDFLAPDGRTFANEPHNTTEHNNVPGGGWPPRPRLAA